MNWMARLKPTRVILTACPVSLVERLIETEDALEKAGLPSGVYAESKDILAALDKCTWCTPISFFSVTLPTTPETVTKLKKALSFTPTPK